MAMDRDARDEHVSSLGVAAIIFACVFGGALLGMLIRKIVPTDHLSQESKDVVKLGTGLIATMAALLLGLLTASAKGSFDAQTNEVKETATNIILLDRVLSQYGPDAAGLRRELRAVVAQKVESIWPTDSAPVEPLETTGAPDLSEQITEQLQSLAPKDEAQRKLQAKAIDLAAAIVRTRWLLFAQAASRSIPMPFLIVVVSWLTVVFISFGILGPPYPIVITVLAFSALSVSGALFLILEMDRPFEGLLRISGDPMHYALAHMGQ
jgi:hypothetical protein